MTIDLKSISRRSSLFWGVCHQIHAGEEADSPVESVQGFSTSTNVVLGGSRQNSHIFFCIAMDCTECKCAKDLHRIYEARVTLSTPPGTVLFFQHLAEAQIQPAVAPAPKATLAPKVAQATSTDRLIMWTNCFCWSNTWTRCSPASQTASWTGCGGPTSGGTIVTSYRPSGSSSRSCSGSSCPSGCASRFGRSGRGHSGS